MSFITNQLTQMRSVLAGYQGHSMVFAGRDGLMKGQASELQVAQGNFEAKCADTMGENAREKMKKRIKLSGFDTFA